MPLTVNTPIRAASVISANAMAAFLLKNNPSPRINCSAQQLAELFIVEGTKLNIRGDIAFCQSIHETGWFKYGGLVLPDQNNYSGIGATNNSPVGKGAWFETPEIGVKAQMQHLFAYACKDILVQQVVDPRFNLVTRGIAPTWEGLNGRWAVPGTTYAQAIIKLYNDLEVFAANYIEPVIEPEIPDEPEIEITEPPSDGEPEPNYPQPNKPAEWAAEAWDWAIRMGITDGSYPQNALTREQTMQLLYNFSKLINANIQVFVGPLAD